MVYPRWDERMSEVEALRVENKVLRRKVAHLEKMVAQLEQRQLGGLGEKKSAVEEESVMSSQLESLLQQVKAAKDEALQFADIGKEQLAADVQHLYRLLKRSRTEGLAKSRRLEACWTETELLRQRVDEMERAVAVGEQAFAELQHRDRAAADARLRKAEERALKREAQLEHLMAWVSTRQQCLVSAAQSLTHKLAEKDTYAAMLEDLLRKEATDDVANLLADLDALHDRRTTLAS